MRKARIWRAFLIKERKFSKNKNAWLGREDSNLRMVESKSKRRRFTGDLADELDASVLQRFRWRHGSK
jgi:hypothetical protein